MKFRSSESGAVLIVVLGILALLTVMAVSFVFSARMEMRASEAYLFTVAATDIAEVGLANAVAVLEADKIYRTDDRLDPNQPERIIETYDALSDIWRKNFSAPVIISYAGTDTDLAAGDEVVNTTNDATAEVIALDTANDRLYLNSVSAALWSVGNTLNRNPASSFNVTVSSVSKPDDVDLDDDGTEDAIWHNYYDDSGDLLGRYAVLIQDESSKINVNVAGNIAQINSASNTYNTGNNDYDHAANEGWSTFEISLADGLGAGETDARNIVLYRHGLPGSLVSGTISGTLPDNRIFVAGQGDLDFVSDDPVTFDDDDDNYNRYFYANDGIDNDGDGEIDESDEGINEPEEFRVLRPVRLRPETAGGGNPLEYDGINNDGDLDYELNDIIDETNEADDQPILTLEQLEDGQSVALGDFLTDPLIDASTPTYFGVSGETSDPRERRHFVTTLSLDRNLNAVGELRVNPNFATPEQDLATLHEVFPPTAVSDDGESDTDDDDPYERHDLRNMQVAVNIYDYRDRDHARTEIQDAAGNVFAGVEAIRINEVMVRAATNLYEAELYESGYWVRASDTMNVFNRKVAGGASPRGDVDDAGNDYYPADYLTNPAGLPDNTTPEDSAEYPNEIVQLETWGIKLPDPPFSSDGGPDGDGLYPFKLRMRVRSDADATESNDVGFEVYVNGSIADSVTSIYHTAPTARWATLNTGTGIENWYIEEAAAILRYAGDPTLTNGANKIQFIKPGVLNPGSPPKDQDTVDIDWFYFTLEPDCEWIELVNIGNEAVDVGGWMVVSEYVRDADDTAIYDNLERESYQLTLPDVGILSVDDPAVWAPGPPHHVVFAVDRNDSAGSSEIAGNSISFENVWSTLAGSANVYQFTSIANIYSGWIDFFGNEPFDDIGDTSGPVGPTNIYLNVDVGRISLYDADGNLVDRVTYDYGDAQAGFRSLQRDHPANPGDRLDSSAYFKRESYLASSSVPIDDYNVIADGAYDDWQFPWDRGYDPTGTDGDRYLDMWSTPAEANNRSDNDTERVATAEGRVKDRFLSSVGELSSVPFYNEYLAVVGYFDGGGSPAPDAQLSVGDTILNDTKGEEAIIVSIDKTDRPANPLAPSGWMVLRGDAGNRVTAWQDLDILLYSDSTVFAGVTSVKPLDTIQVDGLQFYARIDYPEGADDSDLEQSQTITYDLGGPDEQTATAIYVDRTENYMIVQGDAENPVHTWAAGNTIDNSVSGGAFSETISAIHDEYREANVRKLADYFTTAMIDLEAAAASGGPAKEHWPNSGNPDVYTVPAMTANFQITWDEDDGVEDGTYNLYSIVNYGGDADDDVSNFVGPVTVEGGSFTLDVVGAATDQYRFMRAVLAPAPQTFGRINVNTASHQVLQGLPGIEGLGGNDLAKSIIDTRNIALFETIGDIYRVSEIDANFTPAVFSSISNLITTRSDIYKIIVLGQAATDANNNGIIEDDEVTSEKMLEMIYQR